MTPRKVFPNLDLVLLAEQIREEPNNKLTLVGFYPSGKVVLHPREGQTGGFILQSLGLFARFSGGQGDFRVRVELEPPDANVKAVEGDLGITTMEDGTPAVILMSLIPFPVPAPGTFKLRLWLDDRRYEHPFDVLLGDPAVSA